MDKDEILAKLESLGIMAPKRSLGQNFLVSDYVVDRIIGTVGRQKFDALIEIGPGLGSLTEHILKIPKPTFLLELDRTFSDYWRGELASITHPVKLIEGDALQMDWSEFAPAVSTLLVSNLPYQISSSLVIERCLEPYKIDTMILMFQKEVAQRLVAQPKNKDYGLLTVIAQAFWNLDLVCEASPKDFFPAPNIASRVLLFKRTSGRFPTFAERKDFLGFVKAGFAHRRKHLFNNLRDQYFSSRSLDVSLLEKAFAQLKLSHQVRAEELAPAQFADLLSAVQS